MHGTKAYYTAPAMKHYRCYEVHVQRMLAKRIADTITFLPHNITMPNIISTKNAIWEYVQGLYILGMGALGRTDDLKQMIIKTGFKG